MAIEGIVDGKSVCSAIVLGRVIHSDQKPDAISVTAPAQRHKLGSVNESVKAFGI